jgi:hypothetical protein
VIHRHRDAILTSALIVLFAYVMLAQIVFAFRHPWATDTERFLYFGRALTFGTVAYSEARPRE